MKDTIYLDNTTTAADLIARRNAVRAVSNKPNLRFISKPRVVVKHVQALSIVEPATVEYKRIREIV